MYGTEELCEEEVALLAVLPQEDRALCLLTTLRGATYEIGEAWMCAAELARANSGLGWNDLGESKVGVLGEVKVDKVGELTCRDERGRGGALSKTCGRASLPKDRLRERSGRFGFDGVRGFADVGADISESLLMDVTKVAPRR